MSDAASLHVEDLSIGYRVPLHDPFTFSVDPGSVLAVVGPSGCGKSTLLATIAGITPALGGSIRIAGREVTSVPMNERRVGMVFQEALLFPHLNVRDNVAYGPRRRGAPRDDARGQVDRLLAWVELAGYGDRSIEQLSGGQAQRVSLARALAAKPAVLCLDEPFSALDAPLRARLAEDVLSVIDRAGIPAIHVTHDPLEARTMTHGPRGGSILSM